MLPNARVEQIRQVEQNQGKVLSRVSGLMLLLTVAALLAAALAVSAAMAATILERRQEVGLMKSLGAGDSTVASLFLTEAGFLALAGGLIGFLAGAILAHRIGQSIFGSAIEVHPVVLAVVLFAAVLVTFLGSAGRCARPCSLIRRLFSEATHDTDRNQLLLRLLFKAAWVRKDRALTALVSVAVVATIATAALTIYSDLEGKLSREFRGFGANVVVTKSSGALTPSELAEIRKIVGQRRNCARCLCHSYQATSMQS